MERGPLNPSFLQAVGSERCLGCGIFPSFCPGQALEGAQSLHTQTDRQPVCKCGDRPCMCGVYMCAVVCGVVCVCVCCAVWGA